jgi:formylglycine-generating enzyme
MIQKLAVFLMANLVLVMAFQQCGAVNIDTVPVGNPGNSADATGYGSVKYPYRIGKYEVTNAQYVEFLNAVDPTGGNALALYNPEMSSGGYGGIIRNSGAINGSKYTVKAGRDNNPVVFVSFFDAMRFVNWLENGQGNGSTETGVYAIGNGVNEVRNPNATFFLPSENEWYKAAYHKNDGVTGNYWNFTTATDSVPYSDNPNSLNTPDNTNAGNYFINDLIANGYNDGYAVTGGISFHTNQNYLTDVGTYSQAKSAYGTFDQGGNIWEWNEAVERISRGARGGNFSDDPHYGSAVFRFSFHATRETAIGFRIATIAIPEPSTICLVSFTALALLVRKWDLGATALNRRTVASPKR